MKDIYEVFKDYEKEYKKSSKGQRSNIIFPPEIYNEITKHIKGNILDVGTADGYKLEYILKRCNYKKIDKVIAIDPSPLSKKANERLKKFKNVDVYNRCIEDAEFKENFFDTILMFEVIEHLSDPKKDLGRITNLLKPNGVFICSTPNKWVNRISERIIGKKPDPTHINEMTYKQFIFLIDSHFKETKYMGVLPIMFIARKLDYRLLVINRYLSFIPISRGIYCFAKKPRAVR